MDEIYSIIKNMMMGSSKFSTRVPFHAESYKSVLHIWNAYKLTKKINVTTTDNRLLSNIFQFHLSEINHIILYHSKHLEHCLLMCKIGGKYINIVTPVEPLDKLQYSLVATYC